jgi:hypothetical protein
MQAERATGRQLWDQRWVFGQFFAITQGEQRELSGQPPKNRRIR